MNSRRFFHIAGFLLLAAGLSVAALAQASSPEKSPSAKQSPPQTTKAAPVEEAKPRFKVSFVNSCRPTQADVAEMRQLLQQFHTEPAFATDFEIARGVTTLTEAEARAAGVSTDAAGQPSLWVRLHRDLPPASPLSGAQYSISLENHSVSEVLVLHLRNTEKAMQIVLSNTVTGTPEQALHTLTPPDRLRVERYGKPSLILARCPVDQSAYELLFTLGREVFETYRKTMGVERIVPAELERLPGQKESKSPAENQ